MCLCFNSGSVTPLFVNFNDESMAAVASWESRSRCCGGLTEALPDLLLKVVNWQDWFLW